MLINFGLAGLSGSVAIAPTVEMALAKFAYQEACPHLGMMY